MIKYGFILWSVLLLGGCSLGGGDRSRGPGETWVVGISEDLGSMDRARSAVAEQRGYGWSTHLCASEQDGSLADFVVGPVVFSKHDEDTMRVSYAMMAVGGKDAGLVGLLSFDADGVGDEALRRGWDDGFVFRVVIDESLETGFVTVPKIGREGEIRVRWDAEQVGMRAEGTDE
ncbi:MAG: hypothetical protein P1U30_07695 [Phycisphaerales bacterium]|nr:hypothetical protein [Phycisphaerales bacterium]